MFLKLWVCDVVWHVNVDLRLLVLLHIQAPLNQGPWCSSFILTCYSLREKTRCIRHFNVYLRHFQYCSTLHDLPLMDLSVGWFLRQTAALFHLRHPEPVSVSHQPSLHLPQARHRKGWPRLTASQGASHGISQALQGPWRDAGGVVGSKADKKRMLIKWRRHAPGGAQCSAPVPGIITHISSKPICGMCRVNELLMYCVTM